MTCDVILSMRKVVTSALVAAPAPPAEAVSRTVQRLLDDDGGGLLTNPSRVYIGIVRRYLAHNWELSGLGLRDVAQALAALGIEQDRATGLFTARESLEATG